MNRLQSSSLGVGGWILGGLVIFVLLAGCGGGGGGGGGVPPPSGSTSPVLVASDDNGDIHLIDKTTGATILALNVWTENTLGERVKLGQIGGMVYDSARGRMFAVLDNSSPLCQGCTYAINPATGQATLLNDLDQHFGMGDLVLRSDGVVLASSNPEGEALEELNPADGAVLASYFPGFPGFCCGGYGMDFGGDGKLYLVSTWAPNINLHEINPGDPNQISLPSALTPAGFAPSTSATIDSMATSGADLYGIMNDGASDFLVTVDPAGLTVDFAANLALPLDGLAMVPVPAGTVLLAADDLGDIYSIDPATGALTLVKDVWDTDAAGNRVDIGKVGALLFDGATGRMLAGLDNSASACWGCIYTIDPASGQAVLLSNTLVDVADFARRPSDGQVIISERWDGPRMSTLNPATGVVTIVGGNPTCCDGLGMTFGPDGTHYLTGGTFGSGLEWNVVNPADLTLNASTGTVTAQGFPAALSGDEFLNSMAMGADGAIYGILNDSGAYHLVSIDPAPATPVMTWQASLPQAMDGLTVVGPALLSALAVPQTGTIGGYTFTVVEGAISQAGPDQPITPLGGPATLLFDAPIGDLSNLAGQVGLHASGTLNDGGSFAAHAFGTVYGGFVNGLGARIQRNGTAIDYAFLYRVSGALANDTGILAVSMTGTVHLALDVLNTAGNPWIELYPATGSSFCSGTIRASTPDNGMTDRIGIRIIDGTLESLTIGDPLNNC